MKQSLYGRIFWLNEHKQFLEVNFVDLGRLPAHMLLRPKKSDFNQMLVGLQGGHCYPLNPSPPLSEQ